MIADYAGLRVGDRVLVRKDDGTEDEHTVRSAPWQLGHGAWVVGLDGVAGGYALERVVAVLDISDKERSMSEANERVLTGLGETLARHQAHEEERKADAMLVEMVERIAERVFARKMAEWEASFQQGNADPDSDGGDPD